MVGHAWSGLSFVSKIAIEIGKSEKRDGKRKFHEKKEEWGCWSLTTGSYTLSVVETSCNQYKFG